MTTQQILNLLKKKSLPFHLIFESIYFSTPSCDRKYTYALFHKLLEQKLRSLIIKKKIFFDDITKLYFVEQTNEVSIHEED